MATAKGKRLREPTRRASHVSAQVSGRIAIYSGRTVDSSYGRLEVFDPLQEEWHSKEITGEPLLPGVQFAAYAAINNDIFTYGGYCAPGRFLNELHALRNLRRREKVSVTSTSGSPMPKFGSAMVACGKHLIVAGGYGKPNGLIQPGSSFIKNPIITDGRGWTNEIHRLKEGVWTSPAITGDRPPPSAHFSLTSIDQKRAVWFGGESKNSFHFYNDVYIIDLEIMHCTKLSRSGEGPWPVERSGHAACCINYNQKRPKVLISGGGGKFFVGCSDLWILDVDAGRWWKERNNPLPRYRHTVTAASLGPGLTEVIIFGGYNPSFMVAATTLLQFRFIGGVWVLSCVLEAAELGQSEERLKEKLELSKMVKLVFDDALKVGTRNIKQRNLVVVITGIMASGKSSLLFCLFGIEPPKKYTSTGVAERSFRGLRHCITKMGSWELVSYDYMLAFLAPLFAAGISEGEILRMAAILIDSDKAPTSSSYEAIGSTDINHHPSIASTTENTMSSSTITSCPESSSSPSVLSISSLEASQEPSPIEGSSSSQAMLDLVRSCSESKVDAVLNLLHVVDTGGQPEFMEVMPCVIHHSDVTALVLDLSLGLDNCPKVHYHEEGEAFNHPIRSIFTNRQIIHHLACTMQAKRSNKCDMRFKIVVIGTHRDKLLLKNRAITAINHELKKVFFPSSEKELIAWHSHDEILFPINCRTPSRADLQILDEIRKSISDASIGEEVNTPPNYFMFEQDVIHHAKQKSREIVSLAECEEIGQQLKMSPELIQEALIFLNQHNVFLYFPHIIPDVVFTNPQASLNFVNRIVAFRYKVLSGKCVGLTTEYSLSLKRAVITLDMLDHESISSCFFPGLYESHHALRLFTRLSVIGPLTTEHLHQQHGEHDPDPPHSSPKPPNQHTQSYLMPCLLDDVQDFKSFLPLSPVPVFIVHFSGDCVPNGTFVSTLSILLSLYGWEVSLMKGGVPECMAHNIVTLYHAKLPIKLTFLNAIQHFELHVICSEQTPSEAIFSQIRKDIFSAIHKSFEVMHFEGIAIKEAFLCPCKISVSLHHAAIICDDGKYLRCTIDNTSFRVNESQMVWLKECKEATRGDVPTLPELISFPGRKEKINTPQKIGPRCRFLGYILLDDRDGTKVHNITTTCRGDPEEMATTILGVWLRGDGQPVNWKTLVKALEDAGLEVLAADIREVKLPQ